MPIFSEINKQGYYKFHVLQFTWGDEQRVSITRRTAEKLGVVYRHHSIFRKPSIGIGSLLTLLKGRSIIKRYAEEHEVQILMPRSTLPAMMVNLIPEWEGKILFDADGLPLEERVDFSGLSRTSLQYQILKKVQNRMLSRADKVITRSQRAIDYHLINIGKDKRDKFSVVSNGRDAEQFKPNQRSREEKRRELGISKEDIVLVYCGSLGPQYGWKEMISIVEKFRKIKSNTYFLVLTGNLEYAESYIPPNLSPITKIFKIPFAEVPIYLGIADAAFAIRDPKPSMRGVAPIKLGEYLLMGLPTIASKGIGDTELFLAQTKACHLFDHQDALNIEKAVQFLTGIPFLDRLSLRQLGLANFSLTSSKDSYLSVLEQL